MRHGFESLPAPATLNNLDRRHDETDDQEDVKDTTHRVAAEQPQHPQNQENDSYGPQHVRLLSKLINRRGMNRLLNSTDPKYGFRLQKKPQTKTALLPPRPSVFTSQS